MQNVFLLLLHFCVIGEVNRHYKLIQDDDLQTYVKLLYYYYKDMDTYISWLQINVQESRTDVEKEVDSKAKQPLKQRQNFCSYKATSGHPKKHS